MVLASTSSGRRELLSRLGLPFAVCRPPFDEDTVAGLPPPELALRRAVGKARSVASQRPTCVVVGADQVATVDGVVLGKPGTVSRAEEQLQRMAGRWVEFHTGVAVVWNGQERSRVELFEVRLRPLSQGAIRKYVAAEQPLQCAGAFQIEGLGIALMEELRGGDYTSLIGLPLIALTSLLGELGLDVLKASM
jgi:septum formation protein